MRSVTLGLLFFVMATDARAAERGAPVDKGRARVEREACAAAATDACYRRGAVPGGDRIACMAARIERCQARFASETLIVASRTDGEHR